MRDSLTYNMLPIGPDNCINIRNGALTTITASNGYYGYQAPIVEKTANKQQEVTQQMEVQFEDISTPQREFNRKRAFDAPCDYREFKKRRQNEKLDDNAKKKLPEQDLMEELLRETHGCTFYHWLSANES